MVADLNVPPGESKRSESFHRCRAFRPYGLQTAIVRQLQGRKHLLTLRRAVAELLSSDGIRILGNEHKRLSWRRHKLANERRAVLGCGHIALRGIYAAAPARRFVDDQ